jgi:peptidoglycan pentaglycine glycine transferase (the first glycine)
MTPQLWFDAHGQPQAAAMILTRSLSIRGLSPGFKILYIPRGPLLDWRNAALRKRVLEDLQQFTRQKRAVFLKMDPEVIVGRGLPGSEEEEVVENGRIVLEELKERGWFFSDSQIQFRNTIWLDLQPSEEELLANMKNKTRYNIRLAQRKGVEIVEVGLQDLPALYRMYLETSVRDGFVIRSEEYYLRLWELFLQKNLARALIARVEGEVTAGLFLFTFARRAWFLYGMSTQQHREKMPGYLLQWEAIRTARLLGCMQYDLWGAPDTFTEEDQMWGVYRFKSGLGGEVIRTMGAWDYTCRKGMYRLYTHTLPRILNLMRSRRSVQEKQELA